MYSSVQDFATTALVTSFAARIPASKLVSLREDNAEPPKTQPIDVRQPKLTNKIHNYKREN